MKANNLNKYISKRIILFFLACIALTSVVLLLTANSAQSSTHPTMTWRLGDDNGNLITSGGQSAVEFTVTFPSGRKPTFTPSTTTSQGTTYYFYTWRYTADLSGNYCTTFVAQSPSHYSWRQWSYGNSYHTSPVAATTLEQSPVTGKLTYGTPQHNDWGCLEILHLPTDGSTTTPTKTYIGFRVDKVAPSAVSVSTDPPAMTVSSNDAYGIKQFYYFIQPSSKTSSDKCPNTFSSYKKLELIDGTTSDDIAKDVVVAANKRSATVVFTDTLNGRYACFAVKDNNANINYTASRASTRIKSLLPPTLTANTATDKETVTITGALDTNNLVSGVEFNSSSWRYNLDNCTNTANAASPSWKVIDSDGFALKNVANKKEVVLNFDDASIEDSTEICFSVQIGTNTQNVYGTLDYTSPDRFPQMSVTQTGTVIKVSISNAGDITDSSWLWIDAAASACVASNEASLTTWAALSLAADKRSASLDVSAAGVSSTAVKCFKATDGASQTSYISHTPLASDNTAPVITVAQSTSTLSASATDASGISSTSWHYVSHSSSFTCNTAAFTTYSSSAGTGNSVSLSRSQIGHYFCFKVDDSSSNSNTGYSTIKQIVTWDDTAPVITVAQSTSTLSASATDASGISTSSWRYVSNSSSFTCDATAFNSYTPTSSNSVSLSRSQIGHYFCFTVDDTVGNTAYSTIKQVASWPLPDTTAPVITVIQSGSSLSASATDTSGISSSSWRYISSSSSFTCNAAAFSSYTQATGRSLTLNRSQIGRYFCFKVNDNSSNSNTGYSTTKRIVTWAVAVDTTAPSISFSWDSNTRALTISSPDSDVNASTWRYAKFNQQPDCDSSTKSQLIHQLSSNLRLRFSSADSGRWLCVTVADNTGNDGYNKHQLATISGPPPSTTTIITPSSSTTSETEEAAPMDEANDEDNPDQDASSTATITIPNQSASTTDDQPDQDTTTATTTDDDADDQPTSTTISITTQRPDEELTVTVPDKTETEDTSEQQPQTDTSVDQQAVTSTKAAASTNYRIIILILLVILGVSLLFAIYTLLTKSKFFR